MSTKIKLDISITTDVPTNPDDLRLIPTGVRVVKGETRSYFVSAPPLRVLVVLRNGLTLVDLADFAVVDALIGWDDGTPGFVREIHQRHTKITILGPAPGPAEMLLSDVLAKAPPNHDERRTIVAPASLWQRIEQAGEGDLLAGLHALAACY